MRILVLSFNFGRTSSGNATERIVDQLFKNGHSITVICGNNYTENKDYDIIVVNPNPLRPSKILRTLGNILKKELNYIFWELRAKSFCLKLINKFRPDIIYSRGSPVSGMIVGDYLKNKANIPHFIHFADPIPPTKDWMINKLERAKNLRCVEQICKNADAAFFVTKEMLDYQYKMLNITLDLNNNFISPNAILNYQEFGRPNEDRFIFSYVGTFSIQRNPKLITDAFIKFVSDKTNVELHIFGNKSNKQFFDNLNIHHPKIKVFGPTNNVIEVFKKSNTLVDVDSRADEPVFISGKLMEYLSVDRKILLITQTDSPSANLTDKLVNSVVTCDHNLDDIVKSLQKCYDKKWQESDFDERRDLHSEFSIHHIVERLEFNIEKTLNDK